MQTIQSGVTDKVAEAFAGLVIQRMNELSSDWKQPWINVQMKGYPENLSGRQYSRTNALFLLLLCSVHKYKTPCFLTFHQAKEAGLSIRKGARSFPVIYYNFSVKEKDGDAKISFEDYKVLSKEEQERYKVSAFAREHRVFNIEQTNICDLKPGLWEEIQNKFTPDIPEKDMNLMIQCKELDNLVKQKSWICPIHIKPGNEAYYTPVTDEIHLPEKKQFKDGESFYSTLLHELTHSTGTETRLNRDLTGEFGSGIYAREELIAELTAALTMSAMGICTEPKEENVQYLKGWCQMIKEEPLFLMTLLGDVSKASAMIHQEIEKPDLSVKETSNIRIYDQCSEITLTHEESKQSFHFSESNLFIDREHDEIRIAVPPPYAEALLSATRLITNGSILIRSELSELTPGVRLTEIVVSPIAAFPFHLLVNKTDIRQKTEKPDEPDPLLERAIVKDGDFCHLQRVFDKTGSLSFTGTQKIQSPEDVAWIFRSLQNSAIENGYMVYVTQEKAVVQHLSMGSFGCTEFPIGPVIAAVSKIKPIALYMVHNHPSGQLQASREDMMVHNKLTLAFGEIVKEGIIINLTSGKYGLFSHDEDYGAFNFKSGLSEANLIIPVYSFNRLVFDKNFNPDHMESIKSSHDAAGFISSHRLGERNKLSILVMDRGNKVTANIFTPYTKVNMKNACEIASEAVNAAITYGGCQFILNANFEIDENVCKKIEHEAKRISGGEIRTSDILSVQQGKEYISAADNGYLYESSEVYHTGKNVEKSHQLCDLPVSNGNINKIYTAMTEAIQIGIPVVSAPFDENKAESFRNFASEYRMNVIDVMVVYKQKKNELENFFNSRLKDLITNHGNNARLFNINDMENFKKVDETRINWEEMKSRFSITKEMLAEKGVLQDMLYFKKSNALFKVSYEGQDGLKEFDARVQFTEKNGEYSMRFYPVRNKPDLEKSYMGYSFTQEDKRNLMETGHLGKVATISTFGGIQKEAFISIDPLTKEIVHFLREYMKIKDEIGGVKLTDDQKKEILEGKPLLLEGMTSLKGKSFDAFVQIDADKRALAFTFPKPEPIEDINLLKEIKGVAIGDDERMKLARGEKIELSGLERKTGGSFTALVSYDAETKKIKYDFPEQSQATGELFIPAKIKGAILDEIQRSAIEKGEKVLIQGMTSSRGQAFDAYVTLDRETKQISMEYPVKNEIMGVILSPDQKEKLQGGDTVWIQGLTKKNGETFKAPVLWDAKKGAFTFQTRNESLGKGQKAEVSQEATANNEKLAKPIIKLNSEDQNVDKKKGQKI